MGRGQRDATSSLLRTEAQEQVYAVGGAELAGLSGPPSATTVGVYIENNWLLALSYSVLVHVHRGGTGLEPGDAARLAELGRACCKGLIGGGWCDR